jgi:hypothetical protein
LSVALSGDGNTAVIGRPGDNCHRALSEPPGDLVVPVCAGATWVFTRDSSGTWTQQGPKLVGTGDIAASAQQGASVALSADGNTAIVGGPFDSGHIGAAWVFTRSGGVWTQQDNKLVGTGAVGASEQGDVALSADGNTAIVGGAGDNSNIGAAWVFTRSGGVWTQQGNKLVGTGGAGTPYQGRSVALSSDGNTAVVGGYFDSAGIGGMWVFSRSGTEWTQQGGKLVGTGGVGTSYQGTGVALSGDGNTAISGGFQDNNWVGAAWVFTRSGGVWNQQGNKLIGTSCNIGPPYYVIGFEQGWSVALSSDATTAIIGGPGNHVGSFSTNGPGAAWVFVNHVVTTRAATHDFDGDGCSDIALRDNGGGTQTWQMNGARQVLFAEFGTVPTEWSIVGQRDFNGDGTTDFLWRDSSGKPPSGS